MADQHETPDFLTVAEYARTLGVSKLTVYRAIERGQLAHVRVGQTIRIPRTALDAKAAS